MTEGRFIGMDVGGTKIVTAVLEGGEYEIFDPVPTRTDSSDALVDQIVAQIGQHRGENARAVAVGLPSIIEFATGRVRHSVNLPLSDLPLRKLLSERCGLPAYVENDASCAALAEASEAGRIVCENLIMFTIGTGVGGGLVLNGKLYRGATSAAELGHTMIGLDLAGGAPADPGTSRSRARSRRWPRAARSTASWWSRRARTRSRSSGGGSRRATRSPATTRSRARARATCTAST